MDGNSLRKQKHIAQLEADAYLKEMDPLISIPVEEVDADLVLN